MEFLVTIFPLLGLSVELPVLLLAPLLLLLLRRSTREKATATQDSGNSKVFSQNLQVLLNFLTRLRATKKTNTSINETVK